MNYHELSDFRDYYNKINYLDKRYGGPKKTSPNRSNGEYAMRQILQFMSTHRRISCEDIAQEELDKNPSHRRKLKSVTDDIRKFIQNNLLPAKIALDDGFVRRSNKRIQTYSL